jgi:MFS family permease
LALAAVRLVVGRPRFKPLLASICAGAFADAMVELVISWLVLTASNSPLLVGVVFALGMAPQLVLGLPAGALADRYERRVLIALANGAAACIALALSVLLLLGRLSLAAILIPIFFLGIASTLRTASNQALAYDTVGQSNAATAIALANLGSALLGTVGAVVGGVLVGARLPPAAIGLAAILYAAAAFLAIQCRVARHIDIGAAPAALHDGLRLIQHSRVISLIVLLVAATEIFGFSGSVLLPTFARDVFAVGSTGLGALVGAKSLGGVVGLLLFAVSNSTGHKGRWLLVACSGLGVMLAIFAMLPVFALAIFALMVAGGSAAVVDTLAQTLLQDVATGPRRGAAMGVWLFSIGLGPIGFLALGAVALAVGAPAAQLASGLLLIGIVVGLATSPRIRELP